MTPAENSKIDEHLIEQVIIPKSLRDIPVIGNYLSDLASRFLNISDEEKLFLANSFEENKDGALALKFHNPFVEAAILETITPVLRRLIAEAASEAKAREDEEKHECNACAK